MALSSDDYLLYHAAQAVNGWEGLRPARAGQHHLALSQLLGYTGIGTLLGHMDKEDMSRVLRLLTGPHGYAVYRMLQARKVENAIP